MPRHLPAPPKAPLRDRLDRLIALADSLPMGRAADPAAWDPTALASLGDAEDLAQLFGLALGMAIRQGPEDDPTLPAHLLSLAARAIRTGQLGVGEAVASRRRLDRLAAEARRLGAWSEGAPLWWHPLPPPSRLESTWQGLDPAPGSGETPKLRLPDSATLRHALARPDAGGSHSAVPGWIRLDSLARPALVLRLALELAGLPPGLALERSEVADGRLSARRSDSVCYLDGREEILLHDAPTLALVVQWLLSSVAPRLEKALARPVFAPERAMLARYPAPSFGYAPHLDNPGDENDNGRDLTLVVYLNDPYEPCHGGEIALWSPGDSTEAPPAGIFAPTGGSAVLFDARRVPHQVQPLEPGPARWALTLWLSDTPRRPLALAPVPEVSVDQLLAPVDSPPLPKGKVLFHRFEDGADEGRFASYNTPPPGSSPSLGVVATVYRAAHLLDAWCAHHLELGVEHLLLVFDHLEEPGEKVVADRLRKRWGSRLTIWSGADTAERRWPAVPAAVREPLLAASRRQGAADAVAARQALNASAALTAFRQAVAVPAVDWLLHLDADEWLWLAGSGRGGNTLAEHLGAAEAAGWQRLRYLVHELLAPPAEGSPTCFKINPRLARCRLGAEGWRQLCEHLDMAQDAERPYFRAHFNGKSAVRVDRGLAAAGVHDWRLDADTEGEGPESDRSAVLAGPWILHHHSASAEAFAAKYLAMAGAGRAEERLFPPSATETAAVELIERLRSEGCDEVAVQEHLGALNHRLTRFTEAEVSLLHRAGLLTSV